MKPTPTSVRVAVILLAAIAAAMALRVAQGLFAPIVLALVIGVVLAPLVDRLTRAGLAAAPAALMGLLVALAAAALFVLFLEPYVTDLVERAPRLWAEAQEAIANLRHVMRGVEKVADSVAQALDSGQGAAPAAGGTAAQVAEALPDVTDAIGYAPALAGQILIFVGALFFFLLSRGEIYGWIGRALPEFDSERLLAAERLVSRYFLTIALINAVLGALVALVLALVGMPSPVLWGGLAFVMNFVPYLGPAIFALALGVAGILTFDGVLGVAPVACYVALNTLEGQFVTPTLIGRTLAINPLLVFLTLTGWLWLWGAVGGIVALPLLVWALALAGAGAAAEPVPGPRPGSQPDAAG